MRRLAALFCIWMFSALAIAASKSKPAAQSKPARQGPASIGSAQQPQSINVNTHLIVEEVSAKDKNGKPIEGLTANDFTLTEDGVMQTISFVTFQRLESAVNSTASLTSPVDTAPEPTRVPIAPETSADTRYRDHRLLALYFDMSTMQPGDQLRAFESAMEFVDTQMDSSDLIALMTFDEGAVRVQQDFTGDRVQIQNALNHPYRTEPRIR